MIPGSKPFIACEGTGNGRRDRRQCVRFTHCKPTKSLLRMRIQVAGGGLNRLRNVSYLVHIPNVFSDYGMFLIRANRQGK